VAQRLDHAVVEPDPAQPVEQPALTHEVEGGDPAAEPLEGAPAKRGVGVHRVVEGADQQHAGVLEVIHCGWD
jgi:hypothetical protein